MGLEADEELLSDFLVEAGELLERLNEQLVELERQPDNTELLNAVFRAFHTIKGGAGFLQVTTLVAVCHRAEDVFNLLRNGKLRIDPDLMDIVLQVVDVVNAMFGALRGREMPEAADAGLLARLERYARGEAPVAAAPVVAPDPAPDDAVEAAFDALLAEAGETPAAVSPAAGGDEITEAEFDALLDQLHGKTCTPGKTAPAPAASVAPASDEITDAEFDALLDQLHGAGRWRRRSWLHLLPCLPRLPNPKRLPPRRNRLRPRARRSPRRLPRPRRRPRCGSIPAASTRS